MRVLRLIEVQRARTSIHASCAIDDLRFHATVWYADLDLDEVARTHGDDLLERIAVHVALFELSPVASLKPDAIDAGLYSRYVTGELATLWQTVYRNLWGADSVPRFANPAAPAPPPTRVPKGKTELLAFCNGSAQSLVALKLLERGGLPFSTLADAHSKLGPTSEQHVLVDRLAAATRRVRAERQWIVDDLLDSPVLQLRPELGVYELQAPVMGPAIFAALPVLLARGYRGLVAAHPRSSDWEKSWEAEQLFDRYIQTQLLANVRYFSVLAPVYDEIVYELLALDAELATRTSACTIKKPWCGACPACVYAWLQYAAHLPTEVVEATFGKNLGERNVQIVRELLRNGQARLAFRFAKQRKALGPRAAALEVKLYDAAERFVDVGSVHGMPAHVAASVMPQLEAASQVAALRL